MRRKAPPSKATLLCNMSLIKELKKNVSKVNRDSGDPAKPPVGKGGGKASNGHFNPCREYVKPPWPCSQAGWAGFFSGKLTIQTNRDR
jgi:hypothetical protein